MERKRNVPLTPSLAHVGFWTELSTGPLHYCMVMSHCPAWSQLHPKSPLQPWWLFSLFNPPWAQDRGATSTFPPTPGRAEKPWSRFCRSCLAGLAADAQTTLRAFAHPGPGSWTRLKIPPGRRVSIRPARVLQLGPRGQAKNKGTARVSAGAPP